MLVYSPSLIAASALFLAIRMLNKWYTWNPLMVKDTHYTEHQLKPAFKDMCILFTGIERCSLQTIRKKFSLARYHKVALIKVTD
jgi:hypothetical protein